MFFHGAASAKDQDHRGKANNLGFWELERDMQSRNISCAFENDVITGCWAIFSSPGASGTVTGKQFQFSKQVKDVIKEISVMIRYWPTNPRPRSDKDVSSRHSLLIRFVETRLSTEIYGGQKVVDPLSILANRVAIKAKHFYLV
jgi:hypothetical protein